MESSTAIIGVLVSISLIGGGIYLNTDFQPSIPEQSNQTDGTQLTQNTGNGSTLSQGREIKGRNSSSNSSNLTSPKDGIIVSSDPVAGENLRIVVYNQGERVSEETIYVNQQVVGKTSQAGSLTFEVPNTRDIAITTEGQVRDITRTVDGYEEENPVDINLYSPIEQKIQGYKTEIALGIQARKSTDYTISIDDRIVNSSTLEEGESTEYREHEFLPNSGQHVLKVQTGENYTFTETFETTEDIPEPSINVEKPSKGQEIDGYKTEFEYSLKPEYNYDLNLTVNGETIRNEKDVNPEQVDSFSDEIALPAGEHNYKIEVSPKGLNTAFTESGTFSTSRELPVADFELESPKNGVKTSPPVSMSVSIEAYENLEYIVYLEDGSENRSVLSGELTEGQDIHPGNGGTSESYELDYQEHTWYMRINPENSQSLETDTKTFEVVEENPQPVS